MTFSIRDLLLVTMIVALAVGWCVDPRRHQATEGSLRLEIETLRQGQWFHPAWKVKGNTIVPDSSAPAPNRGVRESFTRASEPLPNS